MSVDPPRTRTLPLNAMRVFEAAARHGSFVGAATELGVTPGAIAQQIRKLETWLGAEIFERSAQGVRLSQDRRLIAAEISKELEALASSARRLRNAINSKSIHIAALPAIAQLWLRPRLDSAAKSLGAKSISVTAQEEPPMLDTEFFDAAVFFLPDRHPGGRVIPVEHDIVTPVCSPKIASRLRHPSDLVHETLLHDGVWRSDWRDWLHSVGGAVSISGEGSVYSLYSMALDAALEGEGVLVGHLPLVRSHLASGRLVKPFEPEIKQTTMLAILLPTTSGDEGDAIAKALVGGW